MASTGHGQRSIPLIPTTPPIAAPPLPPASAQSTGYCSISQTPQPVIPRKPVGSSATIRTAGTSQAFQGGTSQSNTGGAVSGATALHGSHNVGGLQGNTSGSNASSNAVTSQTRTSRVLGSRFWPVGNAIVTITLAVFVAALTYILYQWGKWSIRKAYWDYCISSRAYGYIAPDCETVLREGLSLPPLVKWKDNGPSSTLAAPTKALQARTRTPESTWDRRSKLHALVGYAVALVVGVVILVLILLRRPFRRRSSSDQGPRPGPWVEVVIARNISTSQQICSHNLGWASLTYPTTCILSKDFTRLGSANNDDLDDVDLPYQQNENHELSRSKSVEAVPSFGDNDDELAGAVAALTTYRSSEDSLSLHADSTELWERDMESLFNTDGPQNDYEIADVNMEYLLNTDAPHKGSEIADVDIDPRTGFGEQFQNLRVILDSAAPTNLLSLDALDELGLKYTKQTCSTVTGIGGAVWSAGVVELRFKLPATNQLDDKNEIYQAVFDVLNKNAGITFDVLLDRA